MRSRSMVLLALALGCGLVASIGISQVMDRRNQAQAPSAEMEPILIASADLHYNEELSPEKVRFEEWPKGKVPAGALTKLDEIQGRRTATKMFAGEPILPGKLMGSDGAGAARKIPKGYRVISVRVDAVTGASSLIMPDDKVDVLLYMARNPSTGIEETSTKTILHDVRVFAVDTQFERRHEDATGAPKTVSLLVTPDQAETVTLATEMGTIRLVMRSPEDSDHEDSDGASVADIYGGKRPGGPDDPTLPGAQYGLSGPPRQPDSVAAAAAAASGGAPAPAPMAPTPAAPATWTMVLVEGSEMRQVELTTNQNFPVITSNRVDYQPDPPTPPADPVVSTPDTSEDPADDPPLRQPTAGDEGFGDPQEAGPNN